MAPGRPGRHARPHVLKGCKSDDAITAVARRHMSRSDHARYQPVAGRLGPSGQTVLLPVVAPTLFASDFTRALVRWTRSQSTVTRIHVPTMAPGPIGLPVLLRVVLER